MEYTHILVALDEHQSLSDEGLSFEQLISILESEADRVAEELDYLLMSGLITGDDSGYRLADKWWDELSEEDRNEWLNCVGKSAIIDPVLIVNSNPRNLTRGRYSWEDNVCSSFRFGVLPSGDLVRERIVIVSGRYHNPQLNAVDNADVLARIESCLEGQSLYDIDMKIWSHVRDRLLDAGIYGLMIDYLDVAVPR